MTIKLLAAVRLRLSAVLIVSFLIICSLKAAEDLKINSQGYFEKQGLNVLVFSNWYDGNFSDAKISGIELIHHGIRTVTNGDVRLNSTPGQWDPVPDFVDRKVNSTNQTIEAFLKYPAYNFTYSIKTEARDGGIYISVNINEPLPVALEGKAGLNLEFIPSSYYEKTYLMDATSGIFPLYPSGRMKVTDSGSPEPLPLVQGNSLVLAPEDPLNRITVKSSTGDLMLFDGRNQAQNGWFVLRSLIPSGKQGKVIEWFLTANTVEGWIRQPVIAHSQNGYHPSQQKIALVELDRNDKQRSNTSLYKIENNGHQVKVLSVVLDKTTPYLRYDYGRFDFSAVKDEGIYFLEYGSTRSKPFRISADVYQDAWNPTLDVYLPVQMDHMFVNEAYRVWHGISHMDDALQAPVNYEHFDLYAQGPDTDTPFKPGEHIPGLNIGGWYDAGDFDIRTQTQYALIMTLVHAWENFKIDRDETSISQKLRYVDMHVPDGVPDMIQQIEHGTLALIAQFRSIGHAIPGIIAPDLTQYTHLGDAGSKTDNTVCSEKIIPFRWQDFTKCNCDDRWAFTSKSTPLNYGSAAALAAASRSLKGYNDTLASECILTAQKIWAEEHSHKPDVFRFGNTTGGQLETEELTAAAELLIATGDTLYSKRINELLPVIRNQFARTAVPAMLALPYMDEAFKKEMESLVTGYKKQLDSYVQNNPFGVFISAGGWAGSGGVIGEAATCYLLHMAFPDIIGPEYVFRGLNYIYGFHPGSDISFVSGVGTSSKKVAYGNNRADFSFIAGGIVPGVLLLKPDFPENKEDWPFFWGENEYVVNLAGSYIFLVNAANALLNKNN
jgi:hypothetical protein